MAELMGSGNLVLRDLAAAFMEGVQETRPSLAPLICQRIESDRYENKYVYPTAVAKPRIWTDERVPTNIDAVLTFTLTNDTYEVTLDFDGNLIQDSTVLGFSDLIREAGMSMALYPDELVSLLVKNGGTAGNVAYDGNVFYGATHLFAGAGSTNIANTLAGTGTTTAQVKADFSAMLAALIGFKDDKGRLINPVDLNENSLVAHVPKEMWQVALEAINATIVSQTSNILASRARVVPDGYLTDTNDWFLHYTGRPQKPFIWQVREEAKVDTLDFNSEYYKNTGRVRVLSRMRLKMGYHRFERSIRTTN